MNLPENIQCKINENTSCNTQAVGYCVGMTNTSWTLEQRENAQNRNFRQDRLCMSLSKQAIQATRYEPIKRLPDVWIGHSCIGNVTFKSIENAREWAKAMGYEGIYL